VVGDIPEDWKWVKLGDEIELLYGKGLTEKERKNGVYPVYGSSGIIGYHNDYLVKGPGIIIGRKGSVGEVNLSKTNFYPIDTTYYLKLKNDNDIFFFYYLLKTLRLNEINSHSAVPGLSREDVYSLYIPLPPLPEQKAIAEVLSSIDDKIELLHRQNKTLEEMAMTLFGQWFIEPTKDGLPEGWEEVSLGDVFDIGIGRTPPRKESYWFSLNPKDIRWVSVKDLGSIDTYIINTSEFLKEEAIKKFNIPIIPDNTVILSFKLTVGRVGITIGEMVSNEAIAHFKPKPNSKISSNYLYLFLKTLDFSTFGSTSSIAEAINSKIIKEIKIQIPDNKSILSFQSLIDPIFQKIRYNVFQIQALEKLRDILLPKIMSGEVNVL
jgi:type I restriction enzyme S subunit